MSGSELEHLAAARIEEALETTRRLLDAETLTGLGRVGEVLVNSFRAGGKLLAFGNGGSAAEAQHLTGELVGRLRDDRPPFPAIALVEGASTVTAIANDYSYSEVFARQVEALGRSGDVALALTTSGRSENVVRGVQAARRLGLTTIALTGPTVSPVGDAADLCLRLPGADPARIQESHLVASHILCEMVERALPEGIVSR
jgi:D-sedoheptulose 7-phosphate isomerase